MSSSLGAGQLQAIHDAIVDVIEGAVGKVRLVPHGTFKWAELIDHPIKKQQAEAMDTSLGANRFDLELTDIVDNPSTPDSAMSDLRIADVTFRVEFIRYVQHRRTIVDGVSRDEKLTMAAEIDAVVQALGDPNAGGSLETTADGRTTDIASGCVSAFEFPRQRRIGHDLENHLMRTEMTITAIVTVAQEI